MSSVSPFWMIPVKLPYSTLACASALARSSRPNPVARSNFTFPIGTLVRTRPLCYGAMTRKIFRYLSPMGSRIPAPGRFVYLARNMPYCFEYSSQSRWQANTEMERCLLGGLPRHLGYTLHIGGYNGSISRSATHLTGGGQEKSYLGVLPRPIGYTITVSLH